MQMVMVFMMASARCAIQRRPIFAMMVREAISSMQTLEERLGPMPIELCMMNFAVTRELLREQGYSKRQCDEACLLFILHRAYSDYEILVEAKRSILALEKPS